jgi:hypothetical protein
MSREFWQQYQLRLEPWGIEFDTPIQWDEENVNPEQIDLTPEQTDWSACEPQAELQMPRSLWFIDGRRRLDARCLGRQTDNEPLYGAFATFAVGAVAINRALNLAQCQAFKVERTIAIPGTMPPVTTIPCPLGGKNPLIYTPCSHSDRAENTRQAPMDLVQQAMLTAEAHLANQLSQDAEGLIIQDGPLRYGSNRTPQRTLGYVKTMAKQYLPPDKLALLWELNIGQRTPIFRIKAQDYKAHWSWYLRSGQVELTPQRLGYHELHGIVRLDMYGDVPIVEVKKMADLSTSLIPEYASHPSRDPRAPQNLTPVGALEKELGRLMGDRALIARRLQQFLRPTSPTI